MAVPERLFMQHFCLAILPAIIAILVTILLALVHERYKFKRALKSVEIRSPQYVFHLLTFLMFRTYYRTLTVLGVLLFFCGPIPLMIYFFGGFCILGVVYIPVLVLSAFLIGHGLLNLQNINEKILLKHPWANALSNPDLKKDINRITITAQFLTNLKFITKWTLTAALLLALWGLIELQLFIFSDGFNLNSETEIIYIFIPILKLVIAAIVFIGVRFLMLKPLFDTKFWVKILSGR